MKNKNLKFCFVIILSFAMCSLKAQSVVQKQQKDIEQRKRYMNEVLLKAREQQVQQQAERTNAGVQQQNTNNIRQSNIQAVPVQQKKNDIKPKIQTDNKKAVITEHVREKAAIKTEK